MSEENDKNMYSFDDQISFQRRQCEATERVAENINTATVLFVIMSCALCFTIGLGLS